MMNHELAAVLTAEDKNRIERKLAELPGTSDGPTVISAFLPATSQVINVLAQDGDVVSWCLMPARDQGRANALTVLLKHVFRHELEIVTHEVKELADAAIARASATPAA